MRNLFRKLDVSSRVEVARAVERAERVRVPNKGLGGRLRHAPDASSTRLAASTRTPAAAARPAAAPGCAMAWPPSAVS